MADEIQKQDTVNKLNRTNSRIIVLKEEDVERLLSHLDEIVEMFAFLKQKRD